MMTSFFKQRKLRVDIAMIFISVLLVTTIAIIGFTYQRHSRAMLNLSNKLVLQMNQTIVTNMDYYLRPSLFMHIANQVLQDQKLSLSESQRLNGLFREVLDIYPQINTIYIADPQGNFYLQNRVVAPVKNPYRIPAVGDRQIPVQTKYILMTMQHVHGKDWVSIQYENDHNQVLKTEKTDKIIFHPMQRPWYQGAKHISGNYWLGIYRFFNTRLLGVTVASPVFSHQKFSGVIAADFNMNQFANKFGAIVRENKSSAMVFNQQGDVIAYQGFHKTTMQTSGIVNVNRLHNRVMKKAYALYHHLSQNQFTFSQNGTQYIAYISSYAFNPDQNWKIITVVPLNLFIGAIKATNYYTIFFSLLMVIIGVLLVMFSADRISKPIMLISQEMKKIQQLLFSKTANFSSSIYEIQTIAEALNTTQSALSSFAKYVPKMLVSQLLKNKVIAQLGGVKKPMTILFTDIDHYTTTAENMDPEELIAHISEYLNEMTLTIHQYHGNIDKYIGDAIMAFWNDPAEDSAHVLHACQAILSCRMKNKELNKIWQKAGKPLLTTRYGLNTGIAIVGNMGSNDRLNYTVIGDNVNLAARLETLNKIYGTEIIVSEFVYQQCQAEMLFRPLDQVMVRGKHQMTKIYELVAARSAIYSSQVATAEEIWLCEQSHDAYEAFYRQDLVTARRLFEEIKARYPHDGMAMVYLKRISESLVIADTATVSD